MAKNKVIAGDYLSCDVTQVLGAPRIMTSWTSGIDLSKKTVEEYEVLDETRSKSAASVAGRGLVGGLLLGPAGLLAGALTSKSRGLYTIAVRFKDGAKSLLEVDEKIYKALMKSLF